MTSQASLEVNCHQDAEIFVTENFNLEGFFFPQLKSTHFKISMSNNIFQVGEEKGGPNQLRFGGRAEVKQT